MEKHLQKALRISLTTYEICLLKLFLRNMKRPNATLAQQIKNVEADIMLANMRLEELRKM